MNNNLKEETFKLNASNCVYFQDKDKLSNLEFVGYLISKNLSIILDIVVGDDFDSKKDGYIINDIFKSLNDQIEILLYKSSLVSKTEREIIFSFRNCHTYYFANRIDCLNLPNLNKDEVIEFKNTILERIKTVSEQIKEKIIKGEQKNDKY